MRRKVAMRPNRTPTCNVAVVSNNPADSVHKTNKVNARKTLAAINKASASKVKVINSKADSVAKTKVVAKVSAIAEEIIRAVGGVVATERVVSAAAKIADRATTAAIVHRDRAIHRVEEILVINPAIRHEKILGSRPYRCNAGGVWR